KNFSDEVPRSQHAHHQRISTLSELAEPKSPRRPQTIMRGSTLKQGLYSGRAGFGGTCSCPSPPASEMIGNRACDGILLDNEHGSITVDNAEVCIAAAELSGMAPIVRPVGNKPEIIAPFLDRGAWGVQVPHVNTADEARVAVDAVKYSPEGHRGIFSGG